MQRGMLFSFILHITAIIMMMLGLPSFCSKPHIIQDSSITVELVSVAELSNIKFKKANQIKIKKEPTPTKQIVKTPEQTEPEPEKMEEKKTEVVKEQEVPKPEPEKPKPEPIPDPEPKKEEKKEEKKEPVKKKAKPMDADSVLKNLEESFSSASEDQEKKPTKEDSGEPEDSNAKGEFDDSLPLSLSEMDNIRSQVEKNWSKPPSALLVDGIKVVVKFRVNIDGSINNESVALLKNKSSYPNDKYDIFVLTAESAMRAIKRTGSINNLPVDKFSGAGGWEEVQVTFDPSEGS